MEGNKAYLLHGNHSDWIDYAAELPEEKSIVARAIYVHVLQADKERSVADVVHHAFQKQLINLYPEYL